MDFVALFYGGPQDGRAIPRHHTINNRPPQQIDLSNPDAAPDDPAPRPVYHMSNSAGPRDRQGNEPTRLVDALPGYWYVYEPIWLRAVEKKTGDTPK